jgi:hypothetical protein
MAFDYPDKSLSELTDTELLELLEKVSNEVKTRNTLKLDAIRRNPEEAIKTAINTFVENMDEK